MSLALKYCLYLSPFEQVTLHRICKKAVVLLSKQRLQPLAYTYALFTLIKFLASLATATSKPDFGHEHPRARLFSSS